MQLPFPAQVLQKISSWPVGPECNMLISSPLQKLAAAGKTLPNCNASSERPHQPISTRLIASPPPISPATSPHNPISKAGWSTALYFSPQPHPSLDLPFIPLMEVLGTLCPADLSSRWLLGNASHTLRTNYYIRRTSVMIPVWSWATSATTSWSKGDWGTSRWCLRFPVWPFRSLTGQRYPPLLWDLSQFSPSCLP